MSTSNTNGLTPYDTGAILEPQVHSGTSGKVDFENDESATIITVSARPTTGQDGVTVTIYTHSDEPVTVVVDGETVSDPAEKSDGAEPSALAYAQLGRYVAATLGSTAGDWDSNKMTEDIARYATNFTGFPALSDGDADEVKLWRDIADRLGVEHDDDLPEDAEETIVAGK